MGHASAIAAGFRWLLLRTRPRGAPLTAKPWPRLPTWRGGTLGSLLLPFQRDARRQCTQFDALHHNDRARQRPANSISRPGSTFLTSVATLPRNRHPCRLVMGGCGPDRDHSRAAVAAVAVKLELASPSQGPALPQCRGSGRYFQAWNARAAVAPPQVLRHSNEIPLQDLQFMRIATPWFALGLSRLGRLFDRCCACRCCGVEHHHAAIGTAVHGERPTFQGGVLPRADARGVSRLARAGVTSWLCHMASNWRRAGTVS